MRAPFFIRLLCLMIFSLGITSCGFTPIYATGSQTGLLLSDITVKPPQNSRDEYILGKELEGRFGRNLNGSMTLEYGIALSEEGIQSLSDRIQLIGRVDYRMVSTIDGEFLFGGSVENFVSYSTDGILLNSMTQNAPERLMNILADQMFEKITAQLHARLN